MTALEIIGTIIGLLIAGFIFYMIIVGAKEYIKDIIRWIIKEAKK